VSFIYTAQDLVSIFLGDVYELPAVISPHMAEILVKTYLGSKRINAKNNLISGIIQLLIE
jgi:hypothetical protein